MKVGDIVKHPSRGTGTVATVVYSPLTHKPIKAWVAFPFHTSTSQTERKFVCFADDLTVVPTPAVKPTLTIVPAEPTAPSAA